MADSQRVTWMAFAILARFDINIQNMLLLNALSTAQKETNVLEISMVHLLTIYHKRKGLLINGVKVVSHLPLTLDFMSFLGDPLPF